MTTKPTPTRQHKPVNRQRRARIWAVIGALSVLIMFIVGAFLYGQASAYKTTVNDRGYVISQQDQVIGQACEAAGGRVNTDPDVREACARKARGEPAVPEAADVLADRSRTTGIDYARQIDRCYVEVGLTDGAVNRYGPFCGKPGKAGPSGPTGATGAPGTNGADGGEGPQGVGVADVAPNGCNVDITLTDGSTRTVGPFCGPPLPEYSVNRPDGSAVHCVRDGGSDTAPVYTCSQTRPPTTTQAPPATQTETATQTATVTQTTTVQEPGGLLPTG